MSKAKKPVTRGVGFRIGEQVSFAEDGQGYIGEVVTLCDNGVRVRCDDKRVRFTFQPERVA